MSDLKKLEIVGLVEVKKEGVNKVLLSRYDKKIFYEKAKMFGFTNCKKAYIAKEKLTFHKGKY